MRNIISCAVLILFIAFVSGCNTKTNIEVAPYSPDETPNASEVIDTPSILFDLSQDILPSAIAGEPYNFSFCDPISTINGNPRIRTPSEICDLPQDYFGYPSGGNSPYHFQLDSGKGFPPMGLVLHPNGFLDGIPTTLGNSSFSVCAIDQSGKQACSETMIEAKDIKATFDSITCEKDTRLPAANHFIIVAKGTAKGGNSLIYTDSVWENMNSGCTGGVDCNVEDLIAERSDCGTWKLASTNSCTPEYNYGSNSYENEETSWTLAYILRPDQIPITVTARAYVESDYRSVPRSTTPIVKEVTCG